MNKLITLSKQCQTFVEKVSGVRDVSTDFDPGKDEVRVIINEQKAAAAQLDTFQIATSVQTAFGGTIATTIKKGEEETDVRVIFPKAYRQSANSLNQLQIMNTRGTLINLNSVAYFKKNKGFSTIFHHDHKRTITIFGDIDKDNTTTAEVNRKIEPFIQKLKTENPKVYFLLRGENEDTDESMKNLFKAFLISIILIYLILATLFNSLAEPFIIMMAIPFGIIGVIWAFLAHGQPISFLMIMGIIGMNGVVVNDTIILVKVIDDNRRKGMSPHKSIVEGGKRRLRAVLLTSLTTLLGLFPTAYGLGGNDPFIRPMVLALAWGLFFATILIVFLLPCIYAVVDDIRFFIKKYYPTGTIIKEHPRI